MQLLRKLAQTLGFESTETSLAAKLSAEWRTPLHDDAPCGVYLEYDSEYGQLQAALLPKAEVQYGNFIAPAQGPDWKSIESQCRALLGKSRDIHLLITLCRCKAHLSSIESVAEQVSILVGLLHLWPDTIHPQRIIDGIEDPLFQVNAIASIADPQGFVKDLRELALASNTALRLSMRDVEQAYAVPRHNNALTPESVRLQLFDLFDRDPARLLALETLCTSVAALEQWCSTHLSNDAPNLEGLQKILAPYPAILHEYAQRPSHANGMRSAPHARNRKALPEISDVQENLDDNTPDAESIQHAELPEHVLSPLSLSHTRTPTSTHTALPVIPVLEGSSIHDQREYVKNVILQACQWYEENEPSSPVSILLKQALRMVGKRYSEIAQMIPAELLQQWDQNSNSE